MLLFALPAYHPIIAIRKPMNHNSPWPKLVVAINMLQCIGSSRFVFTSLDDRVPKDNLCNIIYTAEGGNNALTLNTYALLKKISTQVTDTCVWMFTLVLSNDPIE